MAPLPSHYHFLLLCILLATTGLLTSTVEATKPITFFAVGDVPYNDLDANNLGIQMQNIPDYADFVIHVGDMRNASVDSHCRQSQYQDVANILKQSPVPVFIVLGDNDWPDCDNQGDAYGYWKGEFLKFYSRHWTPNFQVSHPSDIVENFSFVYKGNLFMGVNMVGRAAMSQDSWDTRMASQANWVIQNIRDYRQNAVPGSERVFIFGHAIARSKHSGFFNPIKSFIQNELQNTVPILYLHGDGHAWKYGTNYFGQKSFLQIMVKGATSEPPLKLVIDPNAKNLSPNTKAAFPYYRDLGNATRWNTLN